MHGEEEFYLPPPKEPWGPPVGTAREPRVSSTDQLPLLLQTPPSSPIVDSLEPTRRSSKSRRRGIATHPRQAEPSKPKGSRPTSPSSSSLGFSGKRNYDSNCRGKKLRTDKQSHWRSLETNIVGWGGLRGGKELHSGNKTSSNRVYEELDILSVTDHLLTHLAEDPYILAKIERFLQAPVWQRGSS